MRLTIKFLLCTIFTIALMTYIPHAIACTGYYVGKDVSVNGTYMIGHTVDSEPTDQSFVTVVKGSNKPGRSITVGNRQIPLPNITYQYTATPDMNSHSWLNAASNEYGVSIAGSITTYISDAILKIDPYTVNGAAESWVCAYLAATCTTSREAVKTYGYLMDTYGSSESNIFLISDRNEVWYLESYSGHQWCAVKCPDDCVAVFGNECMLGSLKGYIKGKTLFHSDGFYALAEKAGTAVYDDDGFMDVFKSYCGEALLGDYSNRRTWYGHYLLAPSTAGKYNTQTRYDLFFKPDKPVSLDKIFSLTRSRYEGTKYCPDKTGESIRIIGIERQMNCSVIETYTKYPAEMCVITWNTIANAEHSVYLPLSNLATDVADIYNYIPEDYDKPSYRLDIAFTHFKQLCTLAEQNRVLYGVGVRAYWESVEAKLIAEAPSILEKLSALYTKNPNAAAESITAYCASLQKQALKDADTMFEELMWYAISNTNTMPFSEPEPFATSLMPQIRYNKYDSFSL